MTNYLLSIDPSIKNTGFTLGKPCCKHNKSGNEECDVLIDKECEIISAIPILILNYNFNKYEYYDFIEKIIEPLTLKASEDNGNYKCFKYKYGVEDFNVVIERGFNNKLNARSIEKMQSLRGHILSLLYQYYIPEKHGLLPRQWQSGYRLNFNIDDNFLIKGSKEISIKLANQVIQEQGGNITLSNHDEADSLLIGGYYLNKENKNE